MELPDVTMWNAGTEHDEDAFNAVSYAMDFLLSPPQCDVRQTVGQSIPTGVTTATPVTFDTLARDNDGMWNAATPTYITIQTPGWFEVEYVVNWATKASDTTIRIAGLYLNQAYGISSTIGYAMQVNNSSTTPTFNQAYDVFLNVGDKLSFGLMQGTGASLSTVTATMHVRWASL